MIEKTTGGATSDCLRYSLAINNSPLPSGYRSAVFAPRAIEAQLGKLVDRHDKNARSNSATDSTTRLDIAKVQVRVS